MKFYDIKTVNRTTSSGFDTSRSRVGSIGENMKYFYQYYIYVHRKNYSEVLFLIHNTNG